ncbi:hypothetical protein ACP6JC_004515 [Aspergillus fumigatus]
MVPVDMVSFASVENASSESFLSLKRVTKVSIPHNLSYHILTTRVSEANIDTEGEPRRCNNINLWCPPHQFCYRSVCVSIGALSARADAVFHEETRCRMNMDCPPSQSCVRGECRRRIPPVA